MVNLAIVPPAVSSNSLRWAQVGVAALFVAAATGLVLHVRLYNFVTDDAFISFVYSRNLVEHGQLVFNLGERVEGYTNFLWTVFLAGWLKLGWQPESSSIVWGVLFAIGTMGVCVWWMYRLREGRTPCGWDVVPALLLAAVPGYACWSAGGLETQMFTFFVTAGSALYLTSLSDAPAQASALLFGLAALTRPEGNLFFAFAAAHRALFLLRVRRAPSRNDALWIGLYLAIVIPHFLWRHHYYGWWVPNTFYIKSSGGSGTWQRGLYYIGRFVQTFLVYLWAIPACLSLLIKRDGGTNRLYRFTLLVVPLFLGYVAAVGGDFMGHYRFVMPIVPLLAIVTTVGLRALSLRMIEAWPRTEVLSIAVVALLLGGYLWHDVGVMRASRIFLGPGASDNGIDTPGYLRWYTADRAAIGKWFGQHAQPDDYAVVGGAGAQVYYSRMRSLDAFGLSDEYIAHKVAAVSNRPGHQKYAPVDYQLARRPTIITSNYYNIGHAPLVRDDAPFWRQHGYHYVSVEIPGLSSPWYTFLKRMDRQVGPLPPVGDPAP